MKKTITILLVMVLLAAFVGCEKKADDVEVNEEQAVEEIENISKEIEEEAKNVVDAVNEVEVDTSLLGVTITIPADFVDEEDIADIKQGIMEDGFKSATVNDDGSVTYVMTKKKHAELMGEMRQSLEESVAEMIGEEGSNITDIEYNNDFTEFTIKTKSEELSMAESFAAMGFYMMGGMYNMFNGTPSDDIYVKYVNADTGVVIQEGSSKDIGQ